MVIVRISVSLELSEERLLAVPELSLDRLPQMRHWHVDHSVTAQRLWQWRVRTPFLIDPSFERVRFKLMPNMRRPTVGTARHYMI